MARSELTSEQAIRSGIARVVVTRHRIERRVKELADQIANCYEGRELTILAVLTGSLVFLADLVRNMPMLMRLDVVSVDSYPGDATRSAGPQLRLPPAVDLVGRDVLILDDILDSGQTLQLLVDTILKLTPTSLRTCVLLRKNCGDLPGRIEPDFVGFDVEDEFVVGYGLDYDNLYRNLPDICVLKDEVIGCHDGDKQK